MSIKRKSTEEFINQINNLHPNKYNIIGEYLGQDKPIKTIYNECGHVGYPRAHSLYKGCNCGVCHGGMKQTHSQFVEKIEKLYPNKYTFLSEYTNSDGRIKVMYNLCGHIAEPKAAYIRQGAGCPICNRGVIITQDEFNERFNELYGNEYECLDNYINYRQNIMIRHNTCGTVFSRCIATLFSDGSCQCPKCNPSSAVYLVRGVNDIHSVNPELESLLKYSEDAYSHTQFSRDKVWFICPYCGKEIYKKLVYVTTNGLCCPECNTNYSYGERFIANFLSELSIDYVYQFGPKWILPYMYDFKFEVDNKKYIIEVDGAWHFENNCKSDMSLNDMLERDNYKQNMATKYGYNLIRLDYNYKSKSNRSSHLINSILNSELVKILHLNNFDFSIVEKRSIEPITKLVADLWNSYDEKAAQKIQKELNMSDNVVRKWLYKASELGMINESPKEIKNLNIKYGIKTFGAHNAISVVCNETGEVFNSFKEAEIKYHAHLSNYFKFDNIKHSGVLPDGTRLTWRKIA